METMMYHLYIVVVFLVLYFYVVHGPSTVLL
jgi:hypothetical protein